jgi:hypothetical protein
VLLVISHDNAPITCTYNNIIIKHKVIIPGTAIAIVTVISLSSTNPGIFNFMEQEVNL